MYICRTSTSFQTENKELISRHTFNPHTQKILFTGALISKLNYRVHQHQCLTHIPNCPAHFFLDGSWKHYDVRDGKFARYFQILARSVLRTRAVRWKVNRQGVCSRYASSVCKFPHSLVYPCIDGRLCVSLLSWFFESYLVDKPSQIFWVFTFFVKPGLQEMYMILSSIWITFNLFNSPKEHRNPQTKLPGRWRIF